MAKLEEFSSIRKNFSKLADFVTIYIAEAHPAERGHFTNNYDVDTHRNMGDRLAAAQVLKEKAGESLKGCQILVDPMSDIANLSYGALPERLYVVLDGTIVYEGGEGPFDYRLDEVEMFLEKYK